MAKFSASPPLRTWTKAYLTLNCRRHSAKGMNKNKQKKKQRIREGGREALIQEQNLS